MLLVVCALLVICLIMPLLMMLHWRVKIQLKLRIATRKIRYLICQKDGQMVDMKMIVHTVCMLEKIIEKASRFIINLSTVTLHSSSFFLLRSVLYTSAIFYRSFLVMEHTQTWNFLSTMALF
jgi:hypothetical protein